MQSLKHTQRYSRQRYSAKSNVPFLAAIQALSDPESVGHRTRIISFNVECTASGAADRDAKSKTRNDIPGAKVTAKGVSSHLLSQCRLPVLVDGFKDPRELFRRA